MQIDYVSCRRRSLGDRIILFVAVSSCMASIDRVKALVAHEQNISFTWPW